MRLVRAEARLLQPEHDCRLIFGGVSFGGKSAVSLYAKTKQFRQEVAMLSPLFKERLGVSSTLDFTRYKLDPLTLFKAFQLELGGHSVNGLCE